MLVVALAGCNSSERAPFDLSRATYVGQEKCVSCHQAEAELYSGSHHDLAMQPATEATVLANFDNVSLEHHGVVNRMFREGDKFIVHTEGPDGQMRDYEIKYVFGVEPLQQYMVEFPHGEGRSREGLPRVQVLRLCWDTVKGEWYYLPPPDVDEKLEPTDDLHWTGIAQRWNNMCAECHSTDYQKNFEPPNPALVASSGSQPETSDISGRYSSTFIEIDVACEACHGPGSVHVELADQWFPGWNRKRGYGLANLKLSAEHQIQACAPCHSRRNVVFGGFRAGDNYYDHYSNQLLTEGIYYPDGQVLDEDYVHGSFIQSKMYHKGIRCSDCHDPHTARLKHEGNAVCTSCHQHPAAKYDSVGHHFHEPESEGAQCVNCHMPATTYMAVDARRDHSLRIPRPDMSLAINTPNACTGCHLEPQNVSPEKHDQLVLYQDWMQHAREGDEEVQAELARADRWCNEACDRWYGENRRREPHFGLAIAAGQQHAPDAAQRLQELLERRGAEGPYIARATALQTLLEVDSAAAASAAAEALKDDHPLVRSVAAGVLGGSSTPSLSVTLLERALQDPVRIVRTEAARNLLDYPRQMWSSGSGAALRNALQELEEGLQYNNDRAGAHLALGILAEQQGRNQQAIQHYQTAIAVEPSVTGPRTNLAALLERQLSSRAASSSGEPSPLQEEISRLRKAELPLLERDVKLLPEGAALQYRYGLALYLDGQHEKALEHLVIAAELDQANASFAQAVAMLYESLERWEPALEWGQAALRRSSGEPSSRLLLDRIRQAAAAAQTPSSSGTP